MKFDPVTFTLHDGRECTLRSAEPEDAAALADYLNRIFGESPYLSRGAGEWTQTVEKELAWIESKLADPRSVLLLAFVDGVIAGDFDLHPMAALCGWRTARASAFRCAGIIGGKGLPTACCKRCWTAPAPVVMSRWSWKWLPITSAPFRSI